jgi:hypothetical protein
MHKTPPYARPALPAPRCMMQPHARCARARLLLVQRLHGAAAAAQAMGAKTMLQCACVHLQAWHNRRAVCPAGDDTQKTEYWVAHHLAPCSRNSHPTPDPHRPPQNSTLLKYAAGCTRKVDLHTTCPANSPISRNTRTRLPVKLPRRFWPGRGYTWHPGLGEPARAPMGQRDTTQQPGQGSKLGTVLPTPPPQLRGLRHQSHLR